MKSCGGCLVRTRTRVRDILAAAIEAVREWRFQPTLLNGVATPVVTVTVQFSLDR